VGREKLCTGGKILTDIVERRPTDTTAAGNIVSKHVNKSALKLKSKLWGRGRKRDRRESVAGDKKKIRRKKLKHAPRKIINKTYIPRFTSVTIQQSIMSGAVEIASVSSEFHIFAHRPIQMCVLWTRDVTFKQIIPVDQNDPEFLISDNNDTYIDIDIQFYVRGKLISPSGKYVDFSDHTGVTNNFRYSLLSQ